MLATGADDHWLIVVRWLASGAWSMADRGVGDALGGWPGGVWREKFRSLLLLVNRGNPLWL
jgi:hypothetical protein